MADIDLTLEVLVARISQSAQDDDKFLNGDMLFYKMQKNVNLMLCEYAEHYYSIVYDPYPISISNVLANLLKEGNLNWGKIVSIYTLLYVYSEKFKGRPRQLKAIRRLFNKFLIEEVAPWIRKTGGLSNYLHPCDHRITLSYLTVHCFIAAAIIIFV